MKFTKLFATALTLWALVYAHPSFAAVATELDASISDCASCDNGVVELTLNGVSRARVEGLAFNEETGKWVGVGKVDYNGQGIAIFDLSAQFQVVLSPSPSAGNPICSRASMLASSITILGSTGYVISTSDFVVDTSLPCATGKMKAVIDEHPKSLGRIKQLFRY